LKNQRILNYNFKNMKKFAYLFIIEGLFFLGLALLSFYFKSWYYSIFCLIIGAALLYSGVIDLLDDD